MVIIQNHILIQDILFYIFYHLIQVNSLILNNNDVYFLLFSIIFLSKLLL